MHINTSITSLIRQSVSARVLTVSSVSSITFLAITTLESSTLLSMQIIVLVRTRTGSLCSICTGEWQLAVEISFLLVGHTKFAPDWCFSLLKQKFRRTKVGCLEDIVRVVNDSAKENYAELVGREDGTVLVPQYNWAEYFTPFFKRQGFKGIESLHHSRTTPGYVVVREYSDSPEKKLKILSDEYLHWVPSSSELRQSPPVPIM